MEQGMEIPYRPLGLLASVLEGAGYAVSHVHEDLIFPNNNAFILRMEDLGAEVSLIFNEESDRDCRDDIVNELAKKAAAEKLKISCCGLYRLITDEKNETVQITFLDD